MEALFWIPMGPGPVILYLIISSVESYLFKLCYCCCFTLRVIKLLDSRQNFTSWVVPTYLIPSMLPSAKGSVTFCNLRGLVKVLVLGLGLLANFSWNGSFIVSSKTSEIIIEDALLPIDRWGSYKILSLMTKFPFIT